MTAPAPARTCIHCNTKPVVRRVHVRTVGSVPVDLGLCDCDYPRCPHPRCKQVLRDVPMNAHKCPHCEGRL